MDDAVRARAAARNAVADTAPVALRDRLDARLKDATMTPGVLTRLAARATEGEFDPLVIDERAAGVQLIYDGLHLTRALARYPPWPDNHDHLEEDMNVLAADVLVARGFHLLAKTEAASKAVETVQNFGRDETDRGQDQLVGDNTLEADVFELAIIAGVTGTDTEVPAGIQSFAIELAGSFDGNLPVAKELLSDSVIDALGDLIHNQTSSKAAPERIWAGSSVTDP